MEMKSNLIAALLRHGQAELGKHLQLSDSETSKKINGESGWKLEQLADALDFVGARIIRGDEDLVLISREELNAYRIFARKYTEIKHDEEGSR